MADMEACTPRRADPAVLAMKARIEALHRPGPRETAEEKAAARAAIKAQLFGRGRSRIAPAPTPANGIERVVVIRDTPDECGSQPCPCPTPLRAEIPASSEGGAEIGEAVGSLPCVEPAPVAVAFREEAAHEPRVIVPAVAPFYDGDVGRCLSDLWVRGCKPSGASRPHEVRSAITWTALCGATTVPLSTANRRRRSQWAECDPITTRVVTPSHAATPKTEAVGGGKGPVDGVKGPQNNTKPEVTKPSRSSNAPLGARARAVAKQIKTNPLRVLGILETGDKNPAWVGAVATALHRSGLGRGTLDSWRSTFARLEGFDVVATREAVVSLKAAVQLWVRVPGGDSDLEEDSSTDDVQPPTGASDLGDGEDGGEGAAQLPNKRENLLRIICANRLVAHVVGSRVCPFCLVSALLGEEVKDEDVSPSAYDRARIMSTPSLGDLSGWLRAVAAAHNREMHAANGNTSASAVTAVYKGNREARENAFVWRRSQFWDSAVVVDSERATQAQRSVVQQQEQLKLMYSDDYGRGDQWFTNAGTLHQLCDVDVIQLPARLVDDLAAFNNMRLTGGGEEGSEDGGNVELGERPPHNAESTLARLGHVRGMLDDLVGAMDAEEAAYAREARAPVRAAGPPPPAVVRGEYLMDGLAVALPLRNAQGPRAVIAELGRLQDRIRAAEAAADEEFEDLRWMGVGVTAQVGRGRLETTGRAEAYLEVSTTATSTNAALVNPARGQQAYGFVCNVPHVAAAVLESLRHEVTDWREMGLRVALYDDLRRPCTQQPSGVEYAWMDRDGARGVRVTMLDALAEWSYSAVFVSSDVVEHAIRGGGSLQLRDGTQWSLHDPEVVVIALNDNSGPGTPGRDIWILSHLTYPLALVADTVTMHEVGIGEPRLEHFVRTASLVDIPSLADKIVFVTPTKTQAKVSFGGRLFPVSQTTRQHEMGQAQAPVVYAVNAQISRVLEAVLNSRTSLRAAFESYATPFLNGKLGWLEVDALVTALTVRWHQRVEGVVTVGYADRRHYGAPPHALRAMGCVPATLDDGEPIEHEAYGASGAVNGMDCRFRSRQCARMFPHVTVGCWSNMAELAVCTGLAVYNPMTTEDNLQRLGRLRSGLSDRMTRGRFLRIAWEDWKRGNAIKDEIAFPAAAEAAVAWADFVHSSFQPDGSTAKWFAETFVTAHLSWSWGANVVGNDRGQAGSPSFTGIRTVSSMWRDVSNTEWGAASIHATGRMVSGGYDLDTRERMWCYRRHIQLSEGADDPVLESLLHRLNMEARDWGLEYRSHPGDGRLSSVAWVVDSGHGATVAERAGWNEGVMHRGAAPRWGWGVQVLVKDFVNDSLKSLVIPDAAANALRGANYAPGTCLYRGAESGPTAGLQRHYLYRTMGYDMSRLAVLMQAAGNAVGRSVAPADAAVVRGSELRAELARVEGEATGPALTQRQKETTDDTVRQAGGTQPTLGAHTSERTRPDVAASDAARGQRDLARVERVVVAPMTLQGQDPDVERRIQEETRR